jgi:putative phosphotransacetylase
MMIKIEVSARHVHLTQEDLEKLFGEGYQLTKLKDLSQTGEFAAQESVKIAGPKNSYEKMRVVGPCRSNTQVELSRTDSFFLGVEAPLRLSGKIERSGTAKLIGPAGEVELLKGVIVPKRHIHMSSEDAQNLGYKNGQEVSVKVDSERSLTFDKVEIRVKENFNTSMHVDTDEANAAGVSGEVVGEIVD